MTLFLWLLVIVVSNAGTFLLLRRKIIHDLTCSGILPVFVGYMECGIKDIEFSCSVAKSYQTRYEKLMKKVIDHARDHHDMRVNHTMSEE